MVYIIKSGEFEVNKKFKKEEVKDEHLDINKYLGL
jgi:hypothetical protein